jgi:hypothetical protein
MNRNRPQCAAAAAVAVLLLALAGCGGSGSSPDGEVPPPAAAPADDGAVPDSAGASPVAFVNYVRELISKASDSLEPSPIGTQFAVPDDERSEPVAVDG